MNILLKLATTFLLLSSLITFFPTSVSACSCAPERSVVENLNIHSDVFSGRVIKIEGVTENEYGTVGDPIVSLKVNRFWKGDVKDVVQVKTHGAGVACGYEFENGKEYLVYASKNDKGQLESYSCSQNKLLPKAHEDIDKLGLPIYNAASGSKVSATTIYMASAVLIILLIIILNLVKALDFRFKKVTKK